MRRMGIGLGVGINRSNYAQGIFSAYQSRVVADGGVTEAGACVDAVSGLLQTASLLLIPSGYKSGKAYAEIPTNGNGDLTWTRASDAWRTNADGLIQRVPWNLLTYSEDFSNAVWGKNQLSVTANSTNAPNGTLTADTLVENTANAIHRIQINSINVVSSTSYTLSAYVKNNGRRYFMINAASAFNARSTFDLQNGVITATFSGSGTITNVGDGWYRVTVTGTASSTMGTTAFYQLNDSGVATDTTYTGDGVSGFFIFGAQLVEGSSAQTYFPTTDRLNVPRLSYMYGSCPALLLEPQRTNLALYSEQFDNAAWAKTRCSITANSVVSPDGNTTADTLVEDTTASATHPVSQGVTLTAAAQTFSVYAKAANRSWIQIALLSTANASAYFNLSNGTVGTVGSAATASIVSVGNGWYRCVITATTAAGANTLGIYPASADATNVYTGNGTASIYIWGAQCEVGAYVTTPIPTTTASATRIADSFSRNNIYTNGLITSSGGTWFVELKNTIAYIRDTFAQSLFIGTDSANTGGNGFAFTFGGSTAQRPLIRKYVSGVETLIGSLTADNNKIAIKWNGSTADVFINGTKVTSATSFSLTNLTFLGGNGSATPIFIQQMALYPEPKSDQFCIDLTT